MTEITRWSCDEVFRLVNDYLDGELVAGDVERIEEHLAECEQCATEFDFEAGVIEEIKAKVRRISVPPRLYDRLQRLLDSVDPPDPA